MKTKPRNAARRVVTTRITNPETRDNPHTGKKELVLGYVCSAGFQRRVLTDPDLFMYVAGTNEVGYTPDGLDKLIGHTFRLHVIDGEKDDLDRCIGIDVVESRMYRSNVTPVKFEKVSTLKLSYELGGKAVKLLQRPFNTSASTSFALIDEIEKKAVAKKPITETTRLGSTGRVVKVVDNVIEIKVSTAAAGNNQAGQPMTAEQMVESTQD